MEIYDVENMKNNGKNPLNKKLVHWKDQQNWQTLINV
jgi:hypothetical protein